MDKIGAHFFLEKLERHINNFDPCLTLSPKEQLQCLYRCVKSMRDYLKMIEIEEQDPEVKDLEMNIGDLVFDAANIVDFFFAGDVGGSEDVLATELARIEEEMESLRSKVERAITTDVDPPLFGLEKKVDLLIGELEYPDQPMTIKSIVGLPGVGKTTLAQKLFDDPRTKEMFEIRGWVTASQKYQKRSLLTDLLSSCSSPVSAEGSIDEQLALDLFRLLKHKRYLIVIDDIWSAEPWHQIRRYFPVQYKGSAIIFTSRIVIAGAALRMEEVFWDTRETKTHYLDPLSPEDSWKLLEATVFGNEGDSCPPELEEAGKLVAKQCAGLPISIIVVGNILKKDKDKTPKRWDQIKSSMDKIDAHFFMEKLERHIINFAPCLTLSQKEQLQCLYRCVKSMRDYLKTIEIEEQDPEVNDLEMNIGDLVFDAENIVDLFFAGGGGGSEDVLATELARIEEEMESLRSEIEQAIAIATVVVGLDEKVDLLIGELDDQDKWLTIKSIVGLPGVGKTTLALKLFDDPRTKDMFEIRGWVNVSQKYQKRSLLTDLLSSCSSPVSAEGSSVEQLAQDLYRLLKDKRYLIVIDDIWSAEPWDQIRRSFPEQRNGSAVIFTSRIAEAALGMDGWQTKTHYLDPLSQEDSWKLLKATVFGNEGHSCPPELEEAGKHVAKQCEGLPISILVVGNILKKDKDKTPKRWAQISDKIVPANYDFLLLSYTHLPLHLKACFLYLGLFPEDYEIPVRQLIRLWIAEGFVTQQDRSKSLEVTAQDYLNDLVDRNLVFVSSSRSDGGIKTCCIHRFLRAFSFQLGMEENFLTHRRFYIGSPTVIENSILSPSALKLRSFVCLTTPDKAPLDSPVFDENNFKLLKALDLIPFRIPFPNDIGNLVLLKYLALWSEVSCLPPSVTKLFNLETLILSTENTLTLPCDIWKMVKLRHLYNKKGALHFDTCLEATTTSPGQTSANILENLQTLHPLCCCNSCTELLVRTPRIRKLGMRGNPVLSPSGGVSIPDFSCLKQLQSLKIVNTGFCPPTSSNIVNLSTLPASLKRLTLTKTFLKWEEILVLGNLDNLEVLKLLDDACVVSDQTSEPDWDTSDLDFSGLMYLKMQRLDIAKWVDYTVSGFQRLEVLVLEECPRLEMLPPDLAQLSSLMIKVTKCNPDLETCAKEIQIQHEEEFGDKNLRVEIVS